MVLFFFFFCKKVLMFRCENEIMYDVSLVHRKPSDIYPPPSLSSLFLKVPSEYIPVSFIITIHPFHRIYAL